MVLLSIDVEGLLFNDLGCRERHSGKLKRERKKGEYSGKGEELKQESLAHEVHVHVVGDEGELLLAALEILVGTLLPVILQTRQQQQHQEFRTHRYTPKAKGIKATNFRFTGESSRVRARGGFPVRLRALLMLLGVSRQTRLLLLLLLQLWSGNILTTPGSRSVRHYKVKGEKGILKDELRGENLEV